MNKGVGVWVFGFLTFFAVLHTFDAYLSLTSGAASSLLRFYPLGHVLTAADTAIYFWGSTILSFVSFGATCAIASHNPIMTLYNKILADIELTEGEADKAVEAEAGVLDMINHSLTSNSIDIHAMKKELKTVEDSQNSLKADVTRLTSMLSELKSGIQIGLRKLETDLSGGRKCPFCGKEILIQFKLCPYCGEKLPYALMQIERL